MNLLFSQLIREALNSFTSQKRVKATDRLGKGKAKEIPEPGAAGRRGKQHMPHGHISGVNGLDISTKLVQKAELHRRETGEKCTSKSQ